MNTFSNEYAAWLSDFYLLSTILLIAVLVAGKVVKQPARRIAISWSAALGLVALLALCAAPDWSTIHMSHPAPLPAVAVSLPSLPPVEFAVTEQHLPQIEAPILEQISQPVAVLPAKPLELKKIILPLMTSGSAAILLWLVAGAWQAKSLRRRAVPASSALKAMLHELSPDEKTTPQLAVLADLPVAVAIGVRRPMILLPKSLADLSQPAKVRSVLAHELAHVQHRDLWFLALHRALLIVLWAHPLVWIWRRQVRLDQETLADAAAAEVISRTDYAGQLVAMARETATVSRRLPLASSVGLWESPSQLKQRVAVLLDEKLTILRSCTRRWRFFSVLTLAAVTLGLSLVTLQPEKVATAETPDETSKTEESTFGTSMKLNNGATVELLGIGTHGLKANRWWDAEGRALKDLPFKAVQANNISPLPNGQLVFRVQGHDLDSDIRWKTLPATNTGEGSVIVDGKKNPRGYYHHAFVLPENEGIFSLSVGVASGEWLTVAKGISSAHGRLGMSVVFSRAFSDNARSAVVIVSLDAFNHREVASRCIAIDKKGKEHIATSHGGTSAGEQNQTQWTFKGLKPVDVDKFALQTRPYEWAEFGGLPPGQLSETIAVTETPASSKSEDNLKFQVREVDRITSESDLAALESNPNIVIVEWANPKDAILNLSYDKSHPPLLRRSDIATAIAKPSGRGDSHYDILIELTSTAGKQFKLDTQKLIGSRLAIMLDGKAIMAPRLMSAISNSLVISSGFNKAQAEELSERIKPAGSKSQPNGKRNISIASPEIDSRRAKTSSLAPVVEVTPRSIEIKELHEQRMDHYKRLHQLRKPNTINGICINENGLPLEGVLIQLVSQRVDRSDSAKEILTTKTNSRGMFLFKKVIDIEHEFPEGIPKEHFQSKDAKIFTIIAKADGRVPGVSSQFTPWIAGAGYSVVWEMPPAKSLRGRITDQEGNPVEGAKLSTGYGGPWAGANAVNRAITNNNGEYVINDLATYDAEEERRKMEAAMKANPKLAATRSSYGDPRTSLLVKHPKYAAKRATIKQVPGRVDVQLAAGSSIKGKIRFPEGEATLIPIAGSVVRLQRVLPKPKPGESLVPNSFQVEKTQVEKTGHYRFESLPAGKYHLTTDVQGWVTQGIENVEVAQGKTVIAPDIRLMHGGRVRVQLVDAMTGEPMRFDVPTKGYINPSERPQREAIFLSRNNVVEFSTKGVGEVLLQAGNYAFFVSVPLPGGGSLATEFAGNFPEWPTSKVVDGELLEISSRMKTQEPPKADGTWATLMAVPVANDGDEAEEKKPINSFVPETPVAEEEDR